MCGARRAATAHEIDLALQRSISHCRHSALITSSGYGTAPYITVFFCVAPAALRQSRLRRSHGSRVGMRGRSFLALCVCTSSALQLGRPPSLIIRTRSRCAVTPCMDAADDLKREEEFLLYWKCVSNESLVLSFALDCLPASPKMTHQRPPLQSSR